MLVLKSPHDAALDLVARLRALRLKECWSQNEMARRAGLRPATYRLFEQTGKISLHRLLAVLTILGRLQDLEQVCAPSDAPASLDELTQKPRLRGRKKTHA